MKPVLPAQPNLPPFDTLPATTAPAREKRRQATTQPAHGHDRLLRRREVQEATGLSRTALYRLIAAKDFPAQVRLSTNTVGWLRSEVDAWIASRVAASRAAKPIISSRMSRMSRASLRES